MTTLQNHTRKGKTPQDTTDPFAGLDAASYTFTIQVNARGYIVTAPDGTTYESTNAAELTRDMWQVRANLYSGLIQDSLLSLVEHASWVRHEPGRRLPNKDGCVYFARGNAYPGLVKIGFSTQLRFRMKALGHDHCCAPFTPIAYAVTPWYGELETALHAYFAPHKATRREFFAEQPVLRWLDGVL